MAQNERFTPPTTEKTFECEGKTFKVGDVIIDRKDNTIAVLADVERKQLKSPLPFLLPDLNADAPIFYIAYIKGNDPGDRVVPRIFSPDSGIGLMKDYDIATEEEIKKFEDALFAEGHIRYKYPELSFEYIPVVGDKVIAWNGDDTSTAIVGTVTSVEGTTSTLNNGQAYEHSLLFYDLPNYDSIVNLNK